VSDETNDGGPAFPVHKYVNADGETFTSEPTGMTIRDYFAAKAMQAMVGNFRVVNHRNPLIDGDVTTMEPNREMILDYNIKTGEYEGASEISSDAYAIADAMLAAREKTK